MTTMISVEILEKLILKLADYIGPATFQYVKLLSESANMVAMEWLFLADIFSQDTDDEILEEVCFQAMSWGITDIRKLPSVITEIEKRE